MQFMVVSAVDLQYVFWRSFVLYELTLLAQFGRGTHERGGAVLGVR